MKQKNRGRFPVLRMVAAVLAAVLLCVPLGGCNIITLVQHWGAGGEEPLTSQDGRYSLTITRGWSDASGQLNDVSALEAADMLREKYVMVIVYTPEEVWEGITLEDFADQMASDLVDSLENGRLTRQPNTVVNGQKALSCEITGGVDNLDITYWVTCTQSDGEYYQIVGWTLSDMADGNKEDIQKVMHSFKTL